MHIIICKYVLSWFWLTTKNIKRKVADLWMYMYIILLIFFKFRQALECWPKINYTYTQSLFTKLAVVVYDLSVYEQHFWELNIYKLKFLWMTLLQINIGLLYFEQDIYIYKLFILCDAMISSYNETSIQTEKS